MSIVIPGEHQRCYWWCIVSCYWRSSLCHIWWWTVSVMNECYQFIIRFINNVKLYLLNHCLTTKWSFFSENSTTTSLGHMFYTDTLQISMRYFVTFCYLNVKWKLNQSCIYFFFIYYVIAHNVYFISSSIGSHNSRKVLQHSGLYMCNLYQKWRWCHCCGFMSWKSLG